MAKLKEIKDALINNLKSDAELMRLFQETIYEGKREGTIDYPNINVFIIDKTEEDYTYPTQRLTARFAILASLKELDADAIYEDLFEYENVVARAICSDRRLGRKSEHLRITNTSYDSELSPVRNFVITVEVQYRQSSTVRT